jgi:hypothetical protein
MFAFRLLEGNFSLLSLPKVLAPLTRKTENAEAKESIGTKILKIMFLKVEAQAADHYMRLVYMDI